MTTTEQVQQYLATADMHEARDWSVAKALGTSLTTMRRRLRREGTNFCALREAEKRRRCMELLAKDPRAGGNEIADSCGFSEKNAATRAFRQWFGCALRDYKTALRGAV
jgi:AraC-like DNA-binding protein